MQLSKLKWELARAYEFGYLKAKGWKGIVSAPKGEVEKMEELARGYAAKASRVCAELARNYNDPDV